MKMKYIDSDPQDSRQSESNRGVERHTHEAVALDAVCSKKSYPEQPDDHIIREPQIPEPATNEISVD